MTPEILLGIVAAFAGFALTTTLAFGVFWLLSRLAGSPNRRFLIWLSFLYGTAAYWLWLANSFRTSAHLSVLATGVSRHQAVSPTPGPFGTFQIPNSWSFPVGMAVRFLGIAYLVILIFMLFTYVKRQRQLHWVRRFTILPPAGIAQAFHQLSESMHVRRSRLLVLSGITSPATFGWIQPTVLLPDVCLKQEQSELEDILRHELHHVRRRDFIWDGVALACRALLFFHPAIWYAVRRIQFERELACDLAVVFDSPRARVRYAESLIHFARLNSPQQSVTWGIDFAAPSEHLKTRVQSILAGSKRIPAWSVCLRVVCALGALIGFIGVAPSLVILFSYSRPQIPQQLTTSAADTTFPVTEVIRRAGRKTRLSKSQSFIGETTLNITKGEGEPDAMPSVDVKSDAVSSPQSNTDPHLLRRQAGNSAPANKPASQQQTIALIDADSDQTKSGKHDKKQALQQSATAALEIYRRLSVLDRH
jgi:beta-lactamase regulating signal transducer with metallopeptidase domain